MTISFIAAKGCVSTPVHSSSHVRKLTTAQDLMLFNLFAALQDAGIVRPVGTGSRVFA